eukprot:TRINITY_DN7172_c2_g1_i1.p1 TRINITY_DN7172_c2_g1~~TRINITY_DN7172_c2_g1_i1.p1  ORF type:complete len:482 (+),score=137.50 TRINITY_DN7172_c2_g1_i1:67-1512(+)
MAGFGAEAAAISALRDGNARAARGHWRDALSCFCAPSADTVACTAARAALALARCTAALRLELWQEAVSAASQGSTDAALERLAEVEAQAEAQQSDSLQQMLDVTAVDESEAGLPLPVLALFRLGYAQKSAGDGRAARRTFRTCTERAMGHAGAMRQLRAAELGCCYEAKHLVEVRELPGKGQGTVAVRDIAAGELLLEERAFATAQGDKNDTALVLNHLLETVHKRMLREPDVKPLIYGLFPSREQSESEFTNHDVRPQGEDEAPYPPALVADLNHLWHILTCNTFRIDAGSGHWDAPEDACSGLFVRASRLNHACRPSCHYSFKNGAVQIRAVRPIKAGEEATIAYVNVYNRPEWRLQKLRAAYHFSCECCLKKDRHQGDIALDALLCSGCTGYLTADRFGVYRCTTCGTVKTPEWGEEMRAHLARLPDKPGMVPQRLVEVWRTKAHPRHSGSFAACTQLVQDALLRTAGCRPAAVRHG